MNTRHILTLLCFSALAAAAPLSAGPNNPSRSAPGRAANEHAESGSLSRGDEMLDSGEFIDSISMDFRAGDLVTIDLSSNQFDTYLLVRCDQNENVQLDNDDHQESTSHSQIVFEVPTTGAYTVGVTSYEPRETGRYDLTVHVVPRETTQAPGQGADRGHRLPPRREQRAPQDAVDNPRGEDGAPRILGVFAGISDYPGDEYDLGFCDQDAVNLFNVMQSQFGMQTEDSALMTNSDATVENVYAALNDLGRRARPQDTLIFFYSGHGGQSQASSQSADPDGIHETLSLYDGEIIDDEFAQVFNASPAGTALVMLDSCFSGGFAKDVVSVDGRMGIFSSEEDVQSMVPGEIEAGGYLSLFVVDALSHDQAASDLNGDRQLTAHELSHYLGERYRNDVRSGEEFKSGTPVSPMQDLSYQRLVVDRGGIGSDEVLFTWR